jgi:hypothetical protein
MSSELEGGEVEKLVITQRSKMRAALCPSRGGASLSEPWRVGPGGPELAGGNS